MLKVFLKISLVFVFVCFAFNSLIGQSPVDTLISNGADFWEFMKSGKSLNVDNLPEIVTILLGFFTSILSIITKRLNVKLPIWMSRSVVRYLVIGITLITFISIGRSSLSFVEIWQYLEGLGVIALLYALVKDSGIRSTNEEEIVQNESLKTQEEGNSFDRSDLIDFGNFLMERQRIRNISDHYDPEMPDELRFAVHDADLANFIEEQKGKEID